jgi:hypothetical protein
MVAMVLIHVLTVYMKYGILTINLKNLMYMKNNLFWITMQIAILVIGLGLSILLGAKNIPFSMVPLIFSVLVLGFMKLFLHRENNFSVKKKFLLKGGGEILLVRVKKEIQIETICASFANFKYFEGNDVEQHLAPIFNGYSKAFLHKKIYFFFNGELYSPKIICFKPKLQFTTMHMKNIEKKNYILIKLKK